MCIRDSYWEELKMETSWRRCFGLRMYIEKLRKSEKFECAIGKPVQRGKLTWACVAHYQRNMTIKYGLGDHWCVNDMRFMHSVLLWNERVTMTLEKWT